MQLAQKSSDLTDVTLAADDVNVPICKHFQTGHCKFGGRCKKRHVPENCPKANCVDKACLQRHPKHCRFFSQGRICKFGEFCSYKHATSPSHGHFHIQIQALEVRIEELCKAIKVLDNEILELKNVNNCEICDYKASSSTTLKTHISKKHKDFIQLPRQERERGALPDDDTLNLSVPGGGRHELSTSSCSLFAVMEESLTMCEWCYCQFKTSSNSEMMKHVKTAHSITTDFVFPQSNVTIVCPEGKDFCGKEFFLDQTFALHVYNEHKVGFNCDHCHAFLPGGDEMQEIHMKLCTFPCSGDSKCFCK